MYVSNVEHEDERCA